MPTPMSDLTPYYRCLLRDQWTLEGFKTLAPAPKVQVNLTICISNSFPVVILLL